MREWILALLLAVPFLAQATLDANGVKLFDVTDLRNPVARPEGNLGIRDARRMYIARTYLYIAAKNEGLIIADVTRSAQRHDRASRERSVGGTVARGVTREPADGDGAPPQR